jgi:hypothetical protein
MVQPPGFLHPSFPNHVCKLQKAIYGLKQAPRAWFSRLSNKLLQIGFVGSKADTSLFIYRTKTVTIYLLIYVDDIIITASDPAAITELLKLLSVDFAVKELGDLHYFLGVEVNKVEAGLLLSQKRYILNLLKKTNMHEAKPITSPMASSSSLSAFSGDPMENPTLYRSTVGSLQYLSFTRPDLGFAVNRVCQFMHRPLQPHWQAVKRILQYLKHTLSHGFLLFSCKHTRMLTGLDVQMIDDPQVHIVFFLVLTWCLGAHANNLQFLGPQQKQSIKQLQTPLPNSYGFVLYFKNLESVYVLHQHFGVIILELHTCWLIRFFMLVQSMWRSIFTLFVIE